ncbi:PepSY domain-containing protein [Ferdinandcohnia quinoae]|uniref:PepSY domain-containing protein n=1 Tax=Fredinandcohnia quinoae TaxID=2918902 RepID=A0AAW5EAM5_9BACI|nr:PepSY domain-containing protein [Fredinandcohnia sp. SECRCQ15]MCH1627027.1 PepSY domain-containing protein [Fredinandcohnia sp. SECRCQ15]
MKQPKLIMVVVSVLLVAFIIWQATKINTSAKPLTGAEAGKLVQDMYSGDIVEIKQFSDVYNIQIKLETGLYQVEINRNSGDISALTRIATGETAKEPIQNEEPNDEDDSEQSPQEASNGITENEAKVIALQQVKGDVDDVDIEQLGGITFYLVEIEREDGEDATVQINAITGEVHTIRWDD